MTKLLVSVRSAIEAQAALAGGADWIDVKEPNRGPLGCADASTIDDVLQLVDGRAPVSAAVGELQNFISNNFAPSYPSLPGFAGGEGRVRGEYGVALAKCGLIGTGSDWRNRWRHWAAILPANCGAVLVAYAEGLLVEAPDTSDVISFALEVETSAVLIDTALKDGRTLFDHWSRDRLADLLTPLRRADIPFALAGSLHLSHVADLLSLNPHWIAVRGAVCVGGRNGLISSELVGKWKAAIVGQSSQACRLRSERVPLPAER